MSALYEIVPNISEGRDGALVDAAVASVAAAGARVIDRTSDAVHHRSVITAAGDREAVLRAAVALAGVCAQRIDLRVHRGAHPRMGALDVLPFVPLREATLGDAAGLAHEAGAAIWQTHTIPSYFYGAAARRPERRLLADVRRGGFEGLGPRLADPGEAPDVGDSVHAQAGAIAIGARLPLVAFNVDLESGDLALARTIARTLRERGGGLGSLRALGLRLSLDVVQVSFNITDVDATPLYRIVELVRALAGDHGVRIRRSELIGLLPRRALTRSAAYYRGDEDR